MNKFLIFLFLLFGVFSVKSQNEVSAHRLFLNHPSTDSYLGSLSNFGNYHLIGTYPGWDKSAIYIAGYNYSNNTSVTTQKVFIGHNFLYDLTRNALHVGSNSGEGIMIGRYRDQLGWDGTGDQPGYHIRFAGYRDVAGNFTGARISALRTNRCCSGLAQGMELGFFVSNSVEWESNGDVNLREAMRINDNGNVAIGKSKADVKLDVAGTIRATEIIVEANGQTADYVFDDGYQLMTLNEIEEFIHKNKHLPSIPSAAEMEHAGVDLARMNKLLLSKIEELTLHLIHKDKQLEILGSELAASLNVQKQREVMLQGQIDVLSKLEERIKILEAVVVH